MSETKTPMYDYVIAELESNIRCITTGLQGKAMFITDMQQGELRAYMACLTNSDVPPAKAKILALKLAELPGLFEKLGILVLKVRAEQMLLSLDSRMHSTAGVL